MNVVKMAGLTLCGMLLAGSALAASVDPVLFPKTAGGEVAECAAAGDYEYAYKIDNWEGDMNDTYTASFEDGHKNEITILNSDGTYFDWSATPYPIGAVIVKGGDAANVFYYDPQASSDTYLFSPNNDSNKPAEVSHATFCWNPEEKMCFKEDTAWAAGSRYVKKGNWATFTSYPTGPVTLYAGQTMPAGTVAFDEEGGKVRITITLNSGWAFGANHLEENIHIEGYSSAPAGNPAPGLFTYKFSQSGSVFTRLVEPAAIYGVHAVVMKQIPCAEAPPVAPEG